MKKFFKSRKSEGLPNGPNYVNTTSEGFIISERGQWDYPGQKTLIPSNNITMKGVPYPVFGTDNTGYSQMMYPGAEYTFPGNMVYEIPMMQSGGTFNPETDEFIGFIDELPKAQTGFEKDGNKNNSVTLYRKNFWDPKQNKMINYVGSENNEYYMMPGDEMLQRRLPELEVIAEKLENTKPYTTILPLGLSENDAENAYSNFIDQYSDYSKDDSIIRDTVIDLTNQKMGWFPFNVIPNEQYSTILGNNYVEVQNETNFPEDYAKNWIKRMADPNDTFRNKSNAVEAGSYYHSKDIPAFYGIEDGKFKVGSPKDFSENTIIVPVRNSTTPYSKVELEKGILNDKMYTYDKSGNKIWNLNSKSKFIVHSPKTKKSIFRTQFDDANYLTSEEEKNSIQKTKKILEDFLKENPDAYIIPIDEGRFKTYRTNPSGITENEIKSWNAKAGTILENYLLQDADSKLTPINSPGKVGFGYNMGILNKANGGPVGDDDLMLSNIYNKYPAFRNMGNVTLKADTGFTREKTGIGDIEFFDSKTKEITYPNGYKVVNPSNNGFGIIYNPNTNTEQNIMLDMLHGMPSDPVYNKIKSELGDAYLNSEFAEDFYNDSKYFKNKVGEEKWKEWYGNDKGFFDKSYLDGVIRNLMFEGTTEDFKKNNYWEDARKEYFKDKDIKTRYTQLENYLKTGQGYVLPEVEIFGDKIKAKGGLVKAQEGLENKLRRRNQSKEDDVLFGYPLKELEVIDEATGWGKIRQDAYKRRLNQQKAFQEKWYPGQEYDPSNIERRAGIYADDAAAKYILDNHASRNDFANRQDYLRSFTPEEREVIARSNYAGNFDPDMGSRFRRGLGLLMGTRSSLTNPDSDLSAEDYANRNFLSNIGDILSPATYFLNLGKGAATGTFASALRGKPSNPWVDATDMTLGNEEDVWKYNTEGDIIIDPLNFAGTGIGSLLYDDLGKFVNVANPLNKIAQKSRNTIGAALISNAIRKGKIKPNKVPKIQRIDPINRSSVNKQNDIISNMSKEDYENFLRAIYTQNREAFDNPLIEFKSSQPSSFIPGIGSNEKQGLLFKEKFCLPGSECAKTSNSVANRIYTDITGKEFDVAGNAHNAWHLEDQMTRFGAMPVYGREQLKVGDRLLMGNGVNQSTYVPGYIADPNIRHAGTYAGIIMYEGRPYQMLFESGRNNPMFINSIDYPITGPNSLQKAFRPQQFIDDEFGVNLVDKNIRYAYRDKPSVATYSSQNKAVQDVLSEGQLYRETIKRQYDITNDEFDELLNSLVGIGAQETKLNSALPASKLLKAKIALQDKLVNTGLSRPIKQAINTGKKALNTFSTKSNLPSYPGSAKIEMDAAKLAQQEGIPFNEALQTIKSQYAPKPRFIPSTVEPSKGMFRQKFQTESDRLADVSSNIGSKESLRNALGLMSENYNKVKQLYPDASPRQLMDLTTLMWNSPGKAKNKELVDFYLFGKNNPDPSRFNFDYLRKVNDYRNNLIDIQPKSTDDYLKLFRNNEYPEIQYKRGGHMYDGGGDVGDGKTNIPKTAMSYNDNRAYFNSHAVLHDNPTYNDWVKKMVYAGKIAYDPTTGISYPLNKKISIPEGIAEMATEAYTKKSINERLRTNKAARKDLVMQSMIDVGNNPLFYAPGVIAALPFVGPAAASATTAMSAPFTVGATTIPGATIGNALGLGFGLKGAYNLGQDLDSGYYTSNAPIGDKIARGFETGLDMAFVPGMLPAVGAGLKELNQVGKNVANTPKLSLAFQSPAERLVNPEAYRVLTGKSSGIRGNILESYYNLKQKNILKAQNKLRKKVYSARRSNQDDLAESFLEKIDILDNDYDKLSKLKNDWRLKYSGLPITRTNMGGGQGRIFKNNLNENELIKVGSYFGNEQSLNNLIELGKTYNNPNVAAAFPTKAIPFTKGVESSGLYGESINAAQFMPKLDYKQGLYSASDVMTPEQIKLYLNELNELGIGIDYTSGAGNIGRVGNKLGLVDLTYVGPAGKRTTNYFDREGIFNPRYINDEVLGRFRYDVDDWSKLKAKGGAINSYMYYADGGTYNPNTDEFLGFID